METTAEEHLEEEEEEVEVEEEGEGMFGQLPYEVQLHIFGYLRLRERILATRVSKKWREALLDDNECKRLMLSKFTGKSETSSHEEANVLWGPKLMNVRFNPLTTQSECSTTSSTCSRREEGTKQ